MKSRQASNNGKLSSYGGQALIEGVLMRGSKALAAAMRSPSGEIVTHTESLSGIYLSKLKDIPFLRGLVILWDALGLGMRYLTLSANLQAEEEDQKIEGAMMILPIVLSLAVALVLFFAAPAVIGHILERFLAIGNWLSNLAEGLIRLAFVMLYILVIGRIPEIRRVFQYHGAEHKTINAYEAGAELEPERVAGFSLEHPRCGTSFLLTLIVFSIILFTIIGPLSAGARIATRIALIPVLAGIAYEYIRLTARHLSHPLVRLLMRPNLTLQRLTTREPDLSMIEVAIVAFNTMLAQELTPESASATTPIPEQLVRVSGVEHQNQ